MLRPANLTQKIIDIVGSRAFFVVTMLLLVVQALWFVLSAQYPMAFDEEFHFGVIKIYAQQWSPFLLNHPAGADVFGAIARDPSFLYHYLLSFPYRLITLFFDSQTVQVICLRLLNVGLFAYSIYLFRQALAVAKISSAMGNGIVAIFVLIPIVPQLAAHVSYDNGLMLCVAVIFLLTARILRKTTEWQFPLREMGWLLAASLLASLVKYESLPIVAAAVLFAFGAVVWTWRRTLATQMRTAWGEVPRKTLVVISLCVVALTGLAVQRYGVNIWQYHSLKPACDTVLSQNQCRAFGPWARNQQLAQTKGTVMTDPGAYTHQWLQDLHMRLFFAIGGKNVNYANYPPLPLPALAAKLLAWLGLAAVVVVIYPVARRNLFLAFCLLAGLGFLVMLWLNNYGQFVDTGTAVAVNGRYLLPILIPLGAVIGSCLAYVFRPLPSLKTIVLTAAVMMFLQGGGVLSFIILGSNNWYWSNQTVQRVNDKARRILKPLVIESGSY